MNRSIFIVVIFFTCLFGCKKADNFKLEPVSDYYPLITGKYITYNLDSLVFTNYGLTLDTVHYQIQYVVDSQIVDNLNRPGYRIIRNIRTDSTQPWVTDHTAFALNTGSTIEFTEDNLKYIKLVEPIQQGFSWSGNSYIEASSLITDVPYLNGWNYVYDSINAPATLCNLTIDSTITVLEANQSDGPQYHVNFANDQISDTTYSCEKYAKGIGLIYRNFFYDVYQPSYTTDPGYIGYGIILTMIDHN
ncbi:MAG TPA: hypothetical protein VK705_11175 [Ferruginibacter sp.]|jgi:hypothetical protein|nr:hypothetical protein [Ferruginibacter sp.]